MRSVFALILLIHGCWAAKNSYPAEIDSPDRKFSVCINREEGGE